MKIQIQNKTKTGADVILDGEWSGYVSGKYLKKIEQLLIEASNIAYKECSSLSNLKVK